MYVDLHDPSINPEHAQIRDHEEGEEDTFNVPFNLYVEGSYFGDSDCLFQKRLFRECMA